MKSSHEGTDSSNQAFKAGFWTLSLKVKKKEKKTIEIVHDNKFWSIWSSSTQFTLLSI